MGFPEVVSGNVAEGKSIQDENVPPTATENMSKRAAENHRLRMKRLQMSINGMLGNVRANSSMSRGSFGGI